MNLNHINIKNFRCFEEIDFDFGISSTVFIGKNGSGKSSILSAIRKGLSFMFADNKQEINFLKNNNNITVRPLALWDTRFDEFQDGFCWPSNIEYKTTFQEKPLEWAFFKKGHPGTLYSSLYNEAKASVLSELIKPTTQWPLFAFFGDSYPHSIMNLGSKASKIIKSDTLPRDFGYYGWDDYGNCNAIWFERFIRINNFINEFETESKNIDAQIIKQEKLIAETVNGDIPTLESIKKRLNQLRERRNVIVHHQDKVLNHLIDEKNYVEEKIVQFTNPVSDKYDFINSAFNIERVYTHKSSKKETLIQFQFKNGTILNSEILPMGYKRLLSIVFDIAYRAFILNKGRSEPKGIVMIDEIELHLHPTLQQEVLQRFTNTFPNIQFIVTTHSPLVISNFKVDDNKCRLIKLTTENNNYSREYVENIYGIDYTTGLTEIMGAPYRASTIDNLIDSIVILSSRNRQADAEKLRNELYEIVGNNNEHINKEIESRIEMNNK